MSEREPTQRDEQPADDTDGHRASGETDVLSAGDVHVVHGVTLEQEERIQAREAELERISAQAELGTQDGRDDLRGWASRTELEGANPT